MAAVLLTNMPPFCTIITSQTRMDNAFFKYIRDGRIRTHNQLRAVYHRLLMSAKPGSSGLDRFNGFLTLAEQYDQAKRFLDRHLGLRIEEQKDDSEVLRMEFFRNFALFDDLDTPYNNVKIGASNAVAEPAARARAAFEKWQPNMRGIYSDAMRSYDRIRLLKYQPSSADSILSLNLKPLFHNIVYYHRTGREMYQRHVKHSLDGILHQLNQGNHPALSGFVHFLFQDMSKGPALLTKTTSNRPAEAFDGKPAG